MLKISVNNKEYRIRFGYKVLCDSDLIDRVMNVFSGGNKVVDAKSTLDIVAEMLLAGLQKYHSDEFGYDSLGRDKAKEKVYDLMDDYEDESTEENPKDCFDLFQMIQDELFENGFFKRAQEASTAPEKKKTAHKE